MSKKTAIVADPLDGLAEQINDAHRQCVEAASSALSHAKRAGELLNEAKGRCLHGLWLSWLKGNFAFSEKTAQNYMRVAREWERLTEGNPQRVADLSYREALQLLEASKEPVTVQMAIIEQPPPQASTVSITMIEHNEPRETQRRDFVVEPRDHRAPSRIPESGEVLKKYYQELHHRRLEGGPIEDAWKAALPQGRLAFVIAHEKELAKLLAKAKAGA